MFRYLNAKLKQTLSLPFSFESPSFVLISIVPEPTSPSIENLTFVVQASMVTVSLN
jgi:hypothetical protein